MNENKAVLMERDYKGCIERFALTPLEFEKEYASARPDMPKPQDGGCAWCIRPMVYLWYALTDIGSQMWNTFFTDMTWGQTEGDIESGNLPSLAPHLAESLRGEIETFQR